VLLAFTNPIKEAIIKNTVENYAEKVLGQEYGSMGFWVALAMVVVYIPLLGRLAATHFFSKDGTIFGIGLAGIVSVALTFAAICMADTSLSGFIPKSIEILVISLCTATVVLLVTSACAQVLSMGFGPSLGLQLIFWNIVFLAQLATRFLMDFWKHV
jgi:phosphotransferase system  glucose/maltose/N-acetylglucosamine-specific IIC component